MNKYEKVHCTENSIIAEVKNRVLTAMSAYLQSVGTDDRCETLVYIVQEVMENMMFGG